MTLAGANVATNETTASTTYTDLATVGPSVTLVTGTSVIVWLSALSYRLAGNGNTTYIAIDISGATTVAAGVATEAICSNPVAGNSLTLSRSVRIDGLTPGTNTFTLKYKIDSGGAFNFATRSIAVLTL